jgi:hypothetical protein
MSDMQFCKAQVRAVKAKTELLGISFSIGEGGILQTQVGASASGAPNKKLSDVAPIAAHGLGHREKRAVGQQRFAYVSVSRAQHDAHIYTNDGSKLSRSLNRESWQRTATEVETGLG